MKKKKASLAEAMTTNPEMGSWDEVDPTVEAGEDATPFSASNAGALFEVMTRGLVAKMFMVRRVTPSAEQWDMIYGGVELALRDLGEIAGELGFELEFRVTDNHPHEPDF